MPETDKLSEETLRQWLIEATNKHTPPAYRTQGITANRLSRVIDALRAARQELATIQAVRCGEWHVPAEMYQDALARVTIAYENYMAAMREHELMWREQFQRDRERIAELVALLEDAPDCGAEAQRKMWLEKVSAALAKEGRDAH